MAQGFVFNLNLFESNTREKDSNILDNLGGTGISDDIALFTNNLRNVDFLRPADIEAEGPDATVFKVKTASKIAFTNRTRVSHGDTEYTVINSDAELFFELIDDNDVKLTYGQLQFNLVRSTAVLFENISNLQPRYLKVYNVTKEEYEEARNTNTPNPRQQLIQSLTPQIDYRSESIAYLDIIEEYNARFDLLKSILTFKNEQSVIDEKFRIKNSIFVTNKDNVDVNDADAPGAFISNSYGQVARIGGNNINPWDTTAAKTTTVAASTTVGNLIVDNPRIDGIAIEDITEGPAVNFTHRIPIVIDGIEYSLLCTDSDLSQNVIELFTLTADKVTANEGDGIRIDLETSGVLDDVEIAYTVTGIDESDLNPGSSPLAGNFIISNNRSSIFFSLRSDLVTEGPETLVVSLDNNRASVTVDINDTSTTPPITGPVYTLAADVTSIDEGVSLVVSLTTQNVPDGVIPYTITGIQTEDIGDETLTGSFNLVSGSGQIAIQIVEDGLTEGTETLTLTLDNIDESIDIDINDTSIG